jgi:hypothetical protein
MGLLWLVANDDGASIRGVVEAALTGISWPFERGSGG